jgi:hypothetical protein
MAAVRHWFHRLSHATILWLYDRTGYRAPWLTDAVLLDTLAWTITLTLLGIMSMLQH